MRPFQFLRWFWILSYRISYQYVFSTSSHHYESSDIRQLHDLVTRLKNITLVVFCYVNFHFLSLTSGLGIFFFFCDVKLPSLPKNIYKKKKSIIRIDVAVTGTHHHNTGSLYSNLTFDLKKLNTLLLRFNKLLLFLFRFSNWTK